MPIIVLRDGEAAGEIETKLAEAGAEYRRLTIYNKHIIVAWPDDKVRQAGIDAEPTVQTVIYTRTPYMLTSRDFIERSSFKVGRAELGSQDLVIVAGPCAVESEDQMLEVARELKACGVHAIRGGAFKPRTSPYSFQGLGEEGLKILAKTRDETGLPVATEVMDTRLVDLAARYVDILWIGARNSQNFFLLREVGRTRKPVLIKRGFGMLIDELLLAAEYVILEGNDKVAVIERGIRTFEKSTRFTLDIAAIPVIKKKSHLPVIVDPSHPAGTRDYVEPLALAAIAAGADGLMIEVHPYPEKAKSDKEQQLTPREFKDLMQKIRRLAEVLGRRIP